jgi:hypothetical protein
MFPQLRGNQTRPRSTRVTWLDASRDLITKGFQFHLQSFIIVSFLIPVLVLTVTRLGQQPGFNTRRPWQRRHTKASQRSRLRRSRYQAHRRPRTTAESSLLGCKLSSPKSSAQSISVHGREQEEVNLFSFIILLALYSCAYRFLAKLTYVRFPPSRGQERQLIDSFLSFSPRRLRAGESSNWQTRYLGSTAGLARSST